jgi:sugar lactone lactonase YvrE
MKILKNKVVVTTEENSGIGLVTAKLFVTVLAGVLLLSFGCAKDNFHKVVQVTQPKIHVLASYAHGNFLENLEVQPDGRLLFSNYPAKTIEVLSQKGETSIFAQLSVYPLGLISTSDGYLVSASGKSLLLGEDVVGTQQFVLLDKSGKQIGQFDAPQIMYLNGMVRLNSETILAVDSLAGMIWKVDTKTQKISPWIQDDSLAPLAGQTMFIPGANGMKLRSDGLIVSNTSKGTLSIIKIGKEGNPISKPELLASVGMIYDFWIRDDESILFTTHGKALKSLSVDGEVTTVLSDGCGGATAIAPYPLNQDTNFVMINDGNMYFGKKDPVQVLLVIVE